MNKNSKTHLLFRVLIHKLSPDLIVLLSVGQPAVFERPLSRVFLAAIWSWKSAKTTIINQIYENQNIFFRTCSKIGLIIIGSTREFNGFSLSFIVIVCMTH